MTVFLVYTDISSRGFIMGRPGVHAFLNGCYLVPRQLDLDCRWSIDWRKQDQGRNCFLCKVEFKTVGGIEVPKLAGDKTRQDNLHWEKRPCRSNPIQSNMFKPLPIPLESPTKHKRITMTQASIAKDREKEKFLRMRLTLPSHWEHTLLCSICITTVVFWSWSAITFVVSVTAAM